MHAKLTSVLFVSGDPNANDLDWKLPLILKYNQLGYNVTVYILYRLRSERKNFFVWVLEKNKINVLYKDDLSFLEPIPDSLYKYLLNSRSKTSQLISKVFFAETHILSRFSLIKYFRRFFIYNKIKNLLLRYRYVFLCQYPTIHPMLVLQAFQVITPNSKAKLISVPDTAHMTWQNEKICDYDLILVNTEKEGRQLERAIDTPCLVVGCQHFRYEWQADIVKYYHKFKTELSCNENVMPEGKETVLLVLPKDKHVQWKNISYEEFVINLCKSTVRDDRYILVKPHPRTSIKKIEAIIDSVLINNYEIVTDSVNYWSDVADKIVGSLSFSVLAILAVKKVPYLYWPMSDAYKNFLDKGYNDEIELFLIKDMQGDYKSIFNRYVVDVFTQEINIADISKHIISQKLNNFSVDFKLERTAHDTINDIDRWFDNSY